MQSNPQMILREFSLIFIFLSTAFQIWKWSSVLHCWLQLLVGVFIGVSAISLGTL